MKKNRKTTTVNNGKIPKGIIFTLIPDYKMLPYGTANTPDEGDTGANFVNARKSCFARKDGKGHHRSSGKKRRFRVSMNRLTRQNIKQKIRAELGF